MDQIQNIDSSKYKHGPNTMKSMGLIQKQIYTNTNIGPIQIYMKYKFGSDMGQIQVQIWAKYKYRPNSNPFPN